MFEKMRIKEHMEVADANSRHLGTVDDIEDDRIKLTKSDSTDGSHHYVPIDDIEQIADNRIYLNVCFETRGRASFKSVPALSHARPPNEIVCYWMVGRGRGLAPTTRNEVSGKTLRQTSSSAAW